MKKKEEKSGAGRPFEHPKKELMQRVSDLACFGVPIKHIARHLGMSDKTLTRHYNDCLDDGKAKAYAMVAKFIFAGATGIAMERDGASYSDCQRAAFFYAKTQMGWRETQHVDHSSTDGTMSPTASDIQHAIIEALRAKHADRSDSGGAE